LKQKLSKKHLQIRFAVLVIFTCFLGDRLAMEIIPGTSEWTETASALLTAGVVYLILWLLAMKPLNTIRERLLDAEQALNSTKEGYWVLDQWGNFIHVNDAYCEMMGYSKSQLLTMKISDLERRAKQERITEQIQRIINRGNEQFETQHRHANGSWIDLEITVTAVDKKHVVAFLRDITQRKLAEKKIRELAYTDNLTGLSNRNYFEKFIGEAEVDARHNSAVILVDLDNFKLINDTRGHLEGDKLLRKVGNLIDKFVSPQISVFRLGGDEFAMVINGLPEEVQESEEHIFLLAENIRTSIEAVVVAGEIQFQISASIGIAVGQPTKIGFENILKRADIALYEAKEKGRNRCSIFKADMQSKLERQVRLEADLRLALNHNELIPYLQPQLDNHEKLVGAEVLLRWKHPKHGFVSPVEFIPIAEETGIIIAIGHWVIEYACQLLTNWQGNPSTNQLQLSINISVIQFEHPCFVESLELILSHYTFDRKLLKLELTESVALVDVNKAIERMNALKATGLSISMDDFGTGHASLNYLRQLPIDQLKIDRSFVIRMTEGPKDRGVVNCIISLGKELGMQVIAEGVETQEQKNMLEGLGCDLYQGYLYSPAVPLLEFQRMAEEERVH
jgi:diguanylate cyclase (GGDEF)-like protein/PAS domain S-box-containing protein